MNDSETASSAAEEKGSVAAAIEAEAPSEVALATVAPSNEPETMSPDEGALEPTAETAEAAPSAPADAPAEAISKSAEPEAAPDAVVSEPVAPSLAVDSIEPSRGPMSGGTVLTIVGKGFEGEVSARLGGASAEVKVEGPSRLSIVVPASDVPGEVALVVEIEGGGHVGLEAAFRYEPPPLLVSVDPSWSSVAGRASVTLLGARFDEGCKVELDGVELASKRIDGTRVEIALPAHAAGAARLTITNLDGQRTAAREIAFVEQPSIDSIEPTRATIDGGIEALVRGRHLAGVVITFDHDPVEVVLGNADEVRVKVPARTEPGRVDVRATEPHGLTHALKEAFEFTPRPAPVLESLGPKTVANAGGAKLTLRGQSFFEGCRVRFLRSEIAAVFRSSNELEIVAPAMPGTGPVDVTVENPDGQASTLARAFSYEAPLPPPILTAVSPARGPQLGGTKVTLLGDDFAEGCRVRFGAVEVPVRFLTRKEVHAFAPPYLTSGEVNVTLVNPGELLSTLEAAFFYDAAPAPVIHSVSPPNGPTSGGTKLVIEGENFSSDCSIFIDRELPQAIPKRSAKELHVVTPPRKTAGVVDVEVSVTGAGKAVKKNAFRYDASPPPTIAQISPNRVGASGGSEVTISGKNFLRGTQVLIDGRAARSVKFVDATTLEIKTPEGSDGKYADVAVKNPDGKEAVQKKALMFDRRYG